MLIEICPIPCLLASRGYGKGSLTFITWGLCLPNKPKLASERSVKCSVDVACDSDAAEPVSWAGTLTTTCENELLYRASIFACSSATCSHLKLSGEF